MPLIFMAGVLLLTQEECTPAFSGFNHGELPEPILRGQSSFGGFHGGEVFMAEVLYGGGGRR